jgi:hypothetical protein
MKTCIELTEPILFFIFAALKDKREPFVVLSLQKFTCGTSAAGGLHIAPAVAPSIASDEPIFA